MPRKLSSPTDLKSKDAQVSAHKIPGTYSFGMLGPQGDFKSLKTSLYPRLWNSIDSSFPFYSFMAVTCQSLGTTWGHHFNVFSLFQIPCQPLPCLHGNMYVFMYILDIWRHISNMYISPYMLVIIACIMVYRMKSKLPTCIQVKKKKRRLNPSVSPAAFPLWPFSTRCLSQIRHPTVLQALFSLWFSSCCFLHPEEHFLSVEILPILESPLQIFSPQQTQNLITPLLSMMVIYCFSLYFVISILVFLLVHTHIHSVL